MLVRCLYASRVVNPAPPDLLESILAQSRAKNPRLGITGLLCFRNDVFVQVLEGGRESVCDLYHSIVRDERHGNIRLLVYEEIAERRFSNWTMGKISGDSINPALLLKYSDKAELNPFGSSGQATMALLFELAAAGSIAGRGT
jgi:Sensors of blue-light using FAD